MLYIKYNLYPVGWDDVKNQNTIKWCFFFIAIADEMCFRCQFLLNEKKNKHGFKREGEWEDEEREIGKTKSERHSSVLWANDSIYFEWGKKHYKKKREKKMSFLNVK